MTITPDTKDWTWVLSHPCEECGFDPGGVDPRAYGARVAEHVELWREVLERPDVAVRPRPDVWSPLEYACHVADVLEVFRGRFDAMVTEDGARFADWDQDASSEGYGARDPSEVAGAVRERAEALREALDGAPEGARGHRGLRSNGSAFTVDTLVVYLAHDLEHHLVDVGASGSPRSGDFAPV